MQIRLLLAVLTAVSTLPCSAAVRAVISNCCSGSGTILQIDSETFATERSINTGAISTGTFSVGENFALTKDGKSAAVLSIGGDGVIVTIVDLTTGTASPPLALPHNYFEVFPIAVNPVSGAIYNSYVDVNGDAHVLQTDPSTLTFVADVNIGNFICSGIVVSPDGQRIYLEPEGSVVTVLRASDLKEVGTFTNDCGGPVAVSPDSRTVYAAGCSAIEEVDAPTLRVTQSVPFGPSANAGALSPDGSEFYVVGSTNEICTFTVSTLALACITPQFHPYQVTVSPNGTVYIGSEPTYGSLGRVAVFDPVTQTITSDHQLPSGGILAAGPGGKQLYFLSGDISQISSTSAVPSTLIARSATIGLAPGGGAYDATDDLVIFQNDNGGVEVYSATTLNSKGIVTFPGTGGFVGYSGSGFYVSSTRSTHTPTAGVIRFDPASLKITGNVGVPCGAVNFTGASAISGNLLYAFFTAVPSLGTCSGIAVVNTQQMALDSILPLPPINTRNFGIPPGGGTTGYGLYLGYNTTPTLYKIDLTSGAVTSQAQLPQASNVTTALAFSPDGKTIYVLAEVNPENGGDGTIFTVDAQTLAITGSADLDVYGFLSVTPDGMYIYSRDPNGVVIISTASLKIVGTIPTTLLAGPVVFAGN